MRAMRTVSFDDPASGLRYQRTPTPEPGPGQIAIDVDHASVGCIEALFTEGLVTIDLPQAPGLEVGGRARILGGGVDGCRVGDAIVALIITGGGSYGQVAMAPAEFMTLLPTSPNPILAAAVPANSTAALVTLGEIADLRCDENVLVHTATGGLRSQMGQMARLLGANRVVGVTHSEAKRQEILDLGYNETWLTRDLAGTDPTRFDVVADPVTSPARLRSLSLPHTGGRLLVLGDASQEQDQQVSATSLWLRGIGVIDFDLRAFSQANPGFVRGHLRRVVELMASEELRVHVTDRLPIQEAAQAIATMRAGTTTDKIVLTHSQG